MGWQILLLVIEQNLDYVDKTMFIPELEKQPHIFLHLLLLLFGKYIFLSMLILTMTMQSHKFQSLFANLWIGHILHSFAGKVSGVVPDFSNINGQYLDKPARSLTYLASISAALCLSILRNMIRQRWKKSAQEDFEEKMELIFKAAKAHQYHLHLIIM